MRLLQSLQLHPATFRRGVSLMMAFLAGAGARPSRAFDAEGHTRIVWQNRATGETAAWMMKGTNFITSGRFTNDLGQGWHAVATADFNRDGETDLLWRSPDSGQNTIWLLRGTNRIASHTIQPGTTNYSVVGAGDFNGDGSADILWRDPQQNRSAVWFMNETDWSGQVGWISPPADSNWTAAATGDFDHDGHPDIFWRHRNTGRNAVWFMIGTNLQRSVEIRPLHDLGFSLAGTGQFNPVGNTDLLWRHTNGQNTIWLMSGTNFLSSVPLPTETNQNWRIVGTGGYTNGLLLSAISDAPRASVLLNWRYGGTNWPTIKRRTLGETAWTTQAVNYLPSRFTDSGLTVGQRYEYEVGGQYLLAGLQATPMEHRGNVILVVENSVARTLAKELKMLEADLVGDGWSVVRTNVPRHNDRQWSANTNQIATIKAFITRVFLADPSATKAVFLIGHVPIPYSGLQNPDGHGARALPADGYYGDVDGLYSDARIDFRSLLDGPPEPRHDNRVHDGKFDQNRYPPNSNGVARLELAVGRVDFAKLPIFKGQSEAALLRRYLDKLHRYRHKQVELPERIAVGSFFPMGVNRELYAHALKNVSRLYGTEPGRVINGDAFLPTNAAVWGIHGGYGLPYGVCGASGVYHECRDLLDSAKEPRLFFANLFSSFCVDLDYTNNFMRAFLGTPNFGLACLWFRPVPNGNIPLSFEQVGLGETLGQGFLRTINDNPDTSADNTYIAFIGDPTLRLQILAPPNALTAKAKMNVTLTWRPSPEPGVQYFVYRSTNDLRGPWTKLTATPLAEARFIDISPPPSRKLYQVRALKLIATGSGSYTNLSQGIFAAAD